MKKIIQWIIDFFKELFKPSPKPVEQKFAQIGPALDFTLKNEGGYTDHPNDKGGATNFGITIGDLSVHLGRPATKQEVKDMTLATATAIYKKNYWDKLRLSELEEQSIATCMFDMGVLFGTSVSAKFAQQVCGVTTDGKIGPKSIAAINNILPDRFISHFQGLCVERFKSIIAKNSSQQVFLKGWLARADRLLTLIPKVTPPVKKIQNKKDDFIVVAKSFLGVPYQWGGDYQRWMDKRDFGLDCSGFEQGLARWQGIDQPGDQTADGIMREYKRRGYKVVKLGQEQCGDRVFYGSGEIAKHITVVLVRGQIIGANGGGSSTTTKQKAQEQGAEVKLAKTDYRRDIICILRPDVEWT